MEASTIPATAAITPKTGRIVAGPLLRLRSDEQLVRLFRSGNEEAFRTIHDRYRTRLLAYARQMLGGSRADAEDALQDVFVRAYGALQANDRDVSLRAWLYRIAHNRCIDELRRPAAAMATAAPEALELVQAPSSDPHDAVQQRESLRRLVEDVGRLPEQQRSALLMREISGMAYNDLAAALDVTVPAVKSLLVRARIGLAQAAEARDTACAAIQADLADAHERGVRASGLVRRHLHDCGGCRAYKREMKALDARFAALIPALGPVGLFAKLLGIGGGGVAAGGGATAAGVGAGATAATGFSATHIVAAVAVAVVSAGGAVEVHRTLTPPPKHQTAHHRAAPAPVQPPLAASGSASAGSATAHTGPEMAARHRDAERRLRLKLTPAAAAAPVLDPVPAVETVEPGTGNGGAAAPAQPTLEPIAPTTPAPEPEPIAGGDGAETGPGSGATTPPPAPVAPPETPPAAEATAPATPIVTAPPTSESTGGAAYAPPARRR